VTYRSASDPTTNDFAKQLLVLLGTLMTAVTSFYLGAGTTASVVAQAVNLTDPAPTVAGISPRMHTIAKDGQTIRLEVFGTNLGAITQVKIVRAGVEISVSGLVATPIRVSCNIALNSTDTPPGEAWDVVLVGGGSRSAILSKALTIA